MAKKLSLCIVCAFIVCGCFGQTKTAETDNFKNELGLNVTNLVTDLLGNNNRSDPGNYLLSYKRLMKNKKAFRLGATINWSFKNEGTGSFQTRLLNQNFQIRAGRETRQTLSPRFQYYYGLDAIFGYKQEQSSTTVGNLNVIQTDLSVLGGIGPVLGFQFAIFPRLLIGTEGSLYVAYSKATTDFKNTGSSAVFPPKFSEGPFAQTNLPKFLFLIVKF